MTAIEKILIKDKAFVSVVMAEAFWYVVN
jgi:hypothetical protein